MIQPRRRSHAHVERYLQGTEYIGVQNVRCIVQNAVVANQLVEQVKLPFHDASQCEEQKDDKRRLQHGNGDIPDSLKNMCAVDFGRFIILIADAGDGSEINDHVIAHVLP
ncbi:hypothetical protein D3C71_1711460 [compost metagenome]